jgi:hypothetical protein
MAPVLPSPQPSAIVLTRERASAFLQDRGYPITAKRLAKLAHEGGGPAYRRWGNRAIYLPSELLSWAHSRASNPQLHSSAHDATPSSHNQEVTSI